MDSATINSVKEKLAEQRHREMLQAIRKLTESLSAIKNDDPELKKLILKNADAIVWFVSKVEELKANPAIDIKLPDIKVDTHQSEVIDSINGLMDMLKKVVVDMDKRIAVLEDRPLPVKLRAERGYDGTIKYVVIEYKK